MILKLELLNYKLSLKKKIMNAFMIEEVQQLHIAVHSESITEREIKKKYECKLTESNLVVIREKLLKLHSRMMYGELGMLNTNDL